MKQILALLTFVAISCASSAQAHEYYLMPDSFSPKAGEKLPVRHKLGQKFKGNELPFINSWNVRSEVWENGIKREVRGKVGDRPALQVTASAPGLMTVVHQSNVDFLTFQSWEKFVTYVRKEGIEHALAASENGIKPKTGLKEGYSRYAKTLINIDGSDEGLDLPVGLKIELVALANPLSLAPASPMHVKVLYEGAPLPDARITVFVGVDTEFKYQLQTDEKGQALIPGDGPGPYLLNAIHMTEPQSEVAKSKKAHWESFWASLTFERK